MPVTEIIKYIILSFVPIGVIFIIINGLISTLNPKKRGIINLIIGLTLFFIFLGSVIIDYFILKEQRLINKLYFSFPIAILIFTLSISIHQFIYAKKHNIRLLPNIRFVRIKEEETERSKPVVKDVPEFDPKSESYVYIIFQYEEYIFLKQELFNYTGYQKEIQEKFPKETVSKIVNEYKLDALDVSYVGQYKTNKRHLFCYLIDLNSVNENIDFLTKINKYSLDNYTIDSFDRELILRILIKEKFTIKKD